MTITVVIKAGGTRVIAVMATIGAPDRATVDRLHAAAMAHGGSDEGAPGQRENGYYVAYWRDPDGNKMNAVALG